MCAAFIFALDGTSALQRACARRGLHRRADGAAATSPAFDEGQQRGGRLHGLRDLTDYRMIASMFARKRATKPLRGVYECIKAGDGGRAVARGRGSLRLPSGGAPALGGVSNGCARLSRIRRLSDKMGVIHPCRGSASYAMRPEEDAQCACELANWRWARRGAALITPSRFTDLDCNAFFGKHAAGGSLDEAIGDTGLRCIISRSATPRRAKSSAARRWVRWVQEDGATLSPARLSASLKRTAPSASWMNTCSPASARSSASGAGRPSRFWPVNGQPVARAAVPSGRGAGV